MGNVNNSFTRITTGDKTVAPGTDDVDFYSAKVTSNIPVQIRQLTIKPKNTSLTADKVQGKFVLRHNGVALRENLEPASVLNAAGVVVENLNILVDENLSAELTLEADLKEDASGNAKFEVTIDSVVDLSNREATLKTKKLDGHTTKIESGKIEASQQNSSVTSTRISKDGTYKVAELSLRAKTEDAKSIKTLEFESTGDLDNLLDIVNEADDYSLYHNGSEVDTNVVVNGKEVKFTLNNNIRIAKNTSEAFYVEVSTKSDVSAANGKKVRFALKKATFVDNNGATQTYAPTSSITVGKEFTVGIKAPVVTLTPIKGNGTSLVIVKIANDSDAAIAVKTATFDIAGRTSG